MYQKINEITDKLFQDIEMTEEAMALKEELTADLNERFSDMLAEGVSEDEAARRISADLEDFGELTGSFPRRQQSLMPISPDSLPVGGVSEIHVRLGRDDLRVLPSEDQRIHLALTGDPEAQWHSAQDGQVLTLEIVRPDEINRAGDTPQTLSGWILKTINSMVSYPRHEHCQGTLYVPAGWHGSMDIGTGSGDVDIDLPLSALSVHSGSGDVSIRAYEGCQKVRVNSASGDIRLNGSAMIVNLNATSGDIDMSGRADCSLRVSTTSGDADLLQVRTDVLVCKTTSGDLTFSGEAREIDYKAVSGDISLSLSGPLRQITGSAVSGDADIVLHDHQPASARATTVSGHVQISCQEGPHAAQISLKSVSGNIKVM